MNFYSQQGGSGITLETLGGVTNDPTGFPVTSDGSPDTDSTISFDNTSRTLTINKVLTQFTFYYKGHAYTKDSAQTATITDTEGLWYFYFDLNGTLQSTQSFTSSLITSNILVAAGYWDADNNTMLLLSDERHQCGMDGYTHLHLHNSLGTRFVSGLALGNFSIGDGSSNTHAQFSFATGVIRDEDLTHTLTAVNSTTGIGIYYRSGAAGNWRRTTQTGYSAKTTGTGRLAYNQYTGGAWQLTEVTDNRYVLYHIFATNGFTDQFISVMGQTQYTTITAARTGAATEINSINLNGLPTKEFKPIGTVIFQTKDTYTSAIKARVVLTDLSANYVDFRFSGLESNISGVSSHNNLSGLTSDDHTQYALLAGRSGGQTLYGGTAASEDLTLYSTSNGTKGKVNLPETTTSTDKDTGCLVLGGGLGVGENINAGGDINAVGVIKKGGVDINTAGTLTNLAYLNQANSFTGLNTFAGIKNALLTKTANYNMLVTDYCILANGNGATVDIKLPTPSVGREVVIKAIDITNTVRIIPNGAETIDGAANYTFVGQYESKTLISDGTNWFVIGVNAAVVL